VAARWGPRIRNVSLKLLPAAALLLLALFSKEVAFFALPLPLVVLMVKDRGLKVPALARASLPLLAALLVYGACRLAVLGAPGVPAASPVEGAGPQLLTSFALIARYLPLLLVPIRLSARHEVAPTTHPDVLFFTGILILVATAIGSVILLRRRSRWSVPLLLFGSTLFPLCAARLIAGALIAERFLFIPSASLALSIALLPNLAGIVVSAIAAPLFLLLLLPRVAIWKDDFTLYSSMLRDSPNSAYVHAVLGSWYYQSRDLPRAIEHHKRAFQLKPEFNESLLNLSAAEDEAGLADSALAHTQLLIKLRPSYAAAWYELGNIQVHADRPDSAAAAYTESIRLDPKFAQAENNLGVVLERMGRIEEAIAHYQRAEEIQPGYVDAANNLARLSGSRKK
jgi:tetratricopeptide (TPR) repeat protein